MTQKKTKLSHDEQVASILEFVPQDVETIVELPSKNKFYELEDPTKPVTVRPMTFEDEKLLAGLKKTTGLESLNLILDRCVTNVSVGQLLQMDKLFLLIKIREISYGADYTPIITCPDCKSVAQYSIHLTEDLSVTYIGDDVTNPRLVELPVIKKVFEVVSPRTVDESYILDLAEVDTNLWRFVNKIEDCEDKAVIAEVIKKLPIQDMHMLLEAINLPTYGLDPRFLYECKEDGCEYTGLMRLPLGLDFFTMS